MYARGMYPGMIGEMRTLLDEERPHLLVAEVRRLARESGLELETGSNAENAAEFARAYVGSEDFSQLDAELQESWRWVLRSIEKAANAVGKAGVVAATVGSKAVAGALTAPSKAINRRKHGSDEPSGKYIRGDEPFMFGDIAFHPERHNSWSATLPGRYEMTLKYKPSRDVFTCEIEGKKLGNYWDADDLGLAVQAALQAIADEP